MASVVRQFWRSAKLAHGERADFRRAHGKGIDAFIQSVAKITDGSKGLDVADNEILVRHSTARRHFYTADISKFALAPVSAALKARPTSPSS